MTVILKRYSLLRVSQHSCPTWWSLSISTATLMYRNMWHGSTFCWRIPNDQTMLSCLLITLKVRLEFYKPYWLFYTSTKIPLPLNIVHGHAFICSYCLLALAVIYEAAEKALDVDTLEEAVANLKQLAPTEMWARNTLKHMVTCDPLALKVLTSTCSHYIFMQNKSVTISFGPNKGLLFHVHYYVFLFCFHLFAFIIISLIPGHISFDRSRRQDSPQGAKYARDRRARRKNQ